MAQYMDTNQNLHFSFYLSISSLWTRKYAVPAVMVKGFCDALSLPHVRKQKIVHKLKCVQNH